MQSANSDVDPQLLGFALKKETKSSCQNALEFAMTIVMWGNDDKDSVKTLEAQCKMAANETMY